MAKKEKIFLLVILIIAFFARVFWISHLDNTVDIWGDWWDEIAFNLVQGNGFKVENFYFSGGEPFYSWRMPAFPLFLAGVFYLDIVF